MNDIPGTGDQPMTPVRFELFGGVRVIRAGVEVAVTQPKQRAILARLLATPREAVSVSELIDSLWPGEPPSSVTNQIHRHIGALRRICQPQLQRREVGRYVLPAGAGYRLNADADECDVTRFRGLVRAAVGFVGAQDRSNARRRFFDSLAVAASPAGDDQLWVLPAFVGLEDERVQAIVGATDQCETPDEYATVLPILRLAAARHPLNETLSAHLMTALTHTGRTAEALAIYARTRAALNHELGSAPGALLATAQAYALRGGADASRPSIEASGDPATVAPAQLPSPLLAFAGRRLLLAALHEQLAEQPPLLFVTGMAGVGKTTFALRLANELAPEYPDGQLYLNLRGFDATATPTTPLDALRDLLEGLGIAAPGQPESVDARSALLRSRLAGKRALVVLDNAHDYQQVEPLLPGAGDVRVIVTSRNWMPGLAAFHQAQRIQLEPFDDSEAVEFFSQRLSAGRVLHDHAGVIRLGRACGGLPLALAIVAARASANPAFPLDLFVREFTQDRALLASLNAGTADLDLSTVFSWSDRGLSDLAARSFRRLSAHPGPDLSAAVAASMTAIDPLLVREVLTELRAASVLREDRPGRYAFHDLVRDYALSLLGDEADNASVALINHYVRSIQAAIVSFGQASVAPAEATLPGVVAETFTSSRDAIRWYRDERAVLHQVCRLAANRGDHRSALALMLDWRPMSQAVDARHDMLTFAELAVRCAELVDDPVLAGEGLRDAASNFARTGQFDRARVYFDRAAEIFSQSGHRPSQANVYRSMALTLAMNPSDRIELLQQALAIACELDDQPTLASSLYSLGLGLLWSGRCDEALIEFDQCATLIDGVAGLAHLTPYLISARSRALVGLDRLEESADEAARALELLRQSGETQGELRLLRSQGDALAALGRRAEAAGAWQRFLALATSPELVRETNAVDDETDGAATIDRVKAKLADLVRAGGD